MKKQTFKGVASAFLLGIGVLATGCGSNSGDFEDGITTLSYSVKMDEGTAMSINLENGSIAKVDPNAVTDAPVTDVLTTVPDSGVAGGTVDPALDPTVTDPALDPAVTDPALDPTVTEPTVTAPSSYVIKTPSLHGTATLSGSTLVYVPDTDWFGTDKVYIEKGTTEVLDYARITVTFTVIGLGDAETANQSPTISGTPETLVGTGYDYSFTPKASDPDGDTLVFEAINVPKWATFDVATGKLIGTTPSISGVYPDITITVTDGIEESILDPFTITVEDKNHAPTISGIADSPVDTNTAYSFIPKATDVDGDTLVFSIANLPTWASFNPNTGEISGTTPAFNRTYSNIILDVTDGIETVTLSPFSIVVESLNSAPVLMGSPTTQIKAGEPYLFKPDASDADGDIMTFSISNKPHWATFDPATGALSGTAQFATDSEGMPLIYTVTISATDGKATTYMPSFDLEVTP